MRSKHGDVGNIREAGRIEANSDRALGWNLGSGWSKWTRRSLHSGGEGRSIRQVLIHERLVSRNRGGSNMAGVGPPWGQGSRLSDQAVGGCQQRVEEYIVTKRQSRISFFFKRANCNDLEVASGE